MGDAEHDEATLIAAPGTNVPGPGIAGAAILVYFMLAPHMQ